MKMGSKFTARNISKLITFLKENRVIIQQRYFGFIAITYQAN